MTMTYNIIHYSTIRTRMKYTHDTMGIIILYEPF